MDPLRASDAPPLAVITVAGAADNVVGLVYVAGYALDEGESVGQLQGGFPDSTGYGE